MKNFVKQLRALSRDESGAAAVEYGLLAGLIAAVIVGSVTTLGTTLQGIFNTIVGSLPGA
ncbi:MAG: Flp family type IVb pilin [Limnohabitans sp.]|jgi:pilus assembly protein Flp/PilA